MATFSPTLKVSSPPQSAVVDPMLIALISSRTAFENRLHKLPFD